MDIQKKWQVLPMTEVVKWGSGGTPKATVKEYYDNGSIPWLVIGDLNDGIVTTSATKITPLGLKNSSAKIVPANILLVAMYGSIGKLGITGMECCTNQAIAFAKELVGVTTKYMYYFMMSRRNELIERGKGGTQKNISQTVLNSMNVPVPSLPEQQRIIAKIEELFAELDKSVAVLKKVKEQLEVYRQAVIDSVFENISENKKIADICEYVTDGDHLPPPKTDTGIPFIMISNVNGNRICWDKTAFVSNEYYKNISFQRKPKKGDVLYTVTGSFGIPILVDFEKKFCFQRHIALLSPKNIVKQKFLYYALQTTGVYMQAVAKATGTAQKTVSLSVLRNMTIPFFDELNVQTNIIDRLDKQLQDCEFMSLNVNNSLQQADALRQSILKKAFGGEL